MTDKEKAEIGCVSCGLCKHFDVNADRPNVVSRCKRLDHKKIKFAKSYFMSYDCGQHSGGCVCRDFEPAKWAKYIHAHWTTYDDFFGEIKDNETVPLVIDNDFSVRYHVLKRDFVNGTFTNADGTLKWVYKMYYKQSRKAFSGYELVKEYS